MRFHNESFFHFTFFFPSSRLWNFILILCISIFSVLPPIYSNYSIKKSDNSLSRSGVGSTVTSKGETNGFPLASGGVGRPRPTHQDPPLLSINDWNFQNKTISTHLFKIAIHLINDWRLHCSVCSQVFFSLNFFQRRRRPWLFPANP